MYPYITLKIKNHTPHIFFYPDEGMSRQLTLVDEKIDNEILNLANKLELVSAALSPEEQLEQILELASESDDQMLSDLPEVEVESLEFSLNKTLNNKLEEILDLKDEYEEIEMSDEVRSELIRNKKADILASLIEQIYNILIAKTLLAAYELEISSIHLENEHNYARFAEKMGDELQKLGLEFSID